MKITILGQSRSMELFDRCGRGKSKQKFYFTAFRVSKISLCAKNCKILRSRFTNFTKKICGIALLQRKNPTLTRTSFSRSRVLYWQILSYKPRFPYIVYVFVTHELYSNFHSDYIQRAISKVPAKPNLDDLRNCFATQLIMTAAATRRIVHP